MSNRDEILTEEMLAKLLTKESDEEISARSIGDLRRSELLPAFDVKGRGLGKGKGTSKSGWRNNPGVIDRARVILRLKKLYPTTAELYFPLWALGFSIPDKIIFEALSYPIDWLVEDLDGMVEKLRPLVEPERQTGLVSDVVSDAVFNMSPVFGVVRATGVPIVPQDAVEAGLNLFFNPDYRLNDVDFQMGRRGYEGWKRRFEAGGTNSTSGEPLGNILDFIFSHAPFLRENLSLHHLQEVMENCTGEILHEVHQDLKVLKEPVTLFAEIMQMMIVHVEDEFKPDPADSPLPQLFSMAKVIAWIDISMRQKGYGDLINHLRSEVVQGIKKDLTPEILQEFSALGPELARAIQENILEMQRSFEMLALDE